MKTKLMGRDPRTVAREISGILESIFPNLTIKTVTHLNRLCTSTSEARSIPIELLTTSKLEKSMLFEVAIIITESQLKESQLPDWDEILLRAVKRQRLFYDAETPKTIDHGDREISTIVGNNLFNTLKNLAHKHHLKPHEICIAPKIPGHSWIASGVGDFSINNTLIEVKCAEKNFSSADYRQVLMYWIMSYMHALETEETEWRTCIMLNPRTNKILEFKFNDLINITALSRSKIELIEAFKASIITSHN
uniref:hypothetical protein n=1 Tax=Pseudomonas chlororaphis TaxID=587753 RepID=UPI0011CDF2C1|nr:hypothetical protein [Pseudomonas chlororaphis]